MYSFCNFSIHPQHATLLQEYVFDESLAIQAALYLLLIFAGNVNYLPFTIVEVCAFKTES